LVVLWALVLWYGLTQNSETQQHNVAINSAQERAEASQRAAAELERSAREQRLAAVVAAAQAKYPLPAAPAIATDTWGASSEPLERSIYLNHANVTVKALPPAQEPPPVAYMSSGAASAAQQPSLSPASRRAR
jgi:hypothetical protein